MKRSSVVISLVALALFALATGVAAVVPYMNYQGYVTENGQPVTGNRDIKFTIYNSETGGTPLWSQTIADVNINNGVFSVLLGDASNPVSRLVITQFPAFLEIELIGAGGPIFPRTPFTSVPYSYRVETVDGAQGGEIDGDLIVNGQISSSSQSSGTIRRWYKTGTTTPFGQTETIITNAPNSIHITGFWISLGDWIQPNEFVHFTVQIGSDYVMCIHLKPGESESWLSGGGAPLEVNPGDNVVVHINATTGVIADFGITVTGYEY